MNNYSVVLISVLFFSTVSAEGETGPAGPAGTDLSEVVAENSALLSELSGKISNVESEQNRQNGTVEKLIALVERQSKEILRLNERVEYMASQLTTFGIFLT